MWKNAAVWGCALAGNPATAGWHLKNIGIDKIKNICEKHLLQILRILSYMFKDI
jgi:hypothetical protein